MQKYDMPSLYISRSLEPVLKKAASEFPAVVLTGPRQSGKTTLLQHLFGSRYRYVSLEPPDVRAAATEDPRGFLELYPSPVIFDEVQYAPDLFPYIKEKIDADRAKNGQYLLTGSQHLLLTEKVTESLAGRAAMLRLFPLSRREAEGQPRLAFVWERKLSSSSRSSHAFGELWKGFLRGGYPELAAQPNRDVSLWHASYIPDLSRTGCTLDSADRGPDPVSEFPPRAGSAKRAARESKRRCPGTSG